MLDKHQLQCIFAIAVNGVRQAPRFLLGAAYVGHAERKDVGGSFVIFSGVAAAKIAVGTMGVAITNAAADTLARSLALELAPIRVNAISPGVIDTGAWDALGEQGKADYFAGISARNPARRIGTAEDIAQGVLFAMTSTFLTGQTLHIDGGEPLTERTWGFGRWCSRIRPGVLADVRAIMGYAACRECGVRIPGRSSWSGGSCLSSGTV